jgi:hypothetical protein
MASRIAEAIDEPERTKQMSRAGRTLVEKQYSLGSMLDQLDHIYMCGIFTATYPNQYRCWHEASHQKKIWLHAA